MGFTFIDLFSGIGGFHQAAASLGGRCLLACDKDPRARELYAEHYGIEPHTDINTAPIVKADMLFAGPPCQAFSTIGRGEGTRDRRGALIYVLARYIISARPENFVIENVKGLLHTEAFQRFKKMLSKVYTVSHSVVDARYFVPQHRERVYLVGRLKGEFNFPIFLNRITSQPIRPFESIQERQERADPALISLISHKFDLQSPLLDHKTTVGFILRAQKNNYINNKLFSTWGIVGTLCATFIPIIYDERHKMARRLSISEMRRCQGFPESFTFKNRTEASHYLGNAVCVPVVRGIMTELIE